MQLKMAACSSGLQLLGPLRRAPCSGGSRRLSALPRRVGTAAQEADSQRRRQRRHTVAAAGRDWLPLLPEEADGWQGPNGDSSGDEEDDDDEAELDLFPEEARGDPEFVVENVLATVLIGLAALATTLILLKLLIVAYSLISAAFRYTVIGLALAVALTAFQPGRWWF